jgi:alpha-tubulin suppressor-like RCC1 family protein
MAIKNGGVYAWGANSHGQLGNGTTANLATPFPVTNLSSGVAAIAAGGSDIGINGPDGTYYSHNLAIQNGAVYAWGDNRYGDLGNGTTTSSLIPVAVNGLTNGVTAIAAGFDFSLAVRNGSAYAWGYNDGGGLGDGTTTRALAPELVDPTDLTNIITVAAGDNSSYALSADGSLWVWGYNGENQLGLGSSADFEYLTPQHLLPPSGYRFTSISAQGDGDFALATVAAIPEPTTLWLTCVVGVALLSRRKRMP